MKDGHIDIVGAWKLSRLGRNQLEVHSIIKELQNQKFDFTSVDDGIDTTNGTGKLLLGILASVNEFERTTIVANLRLGMNQRAKSGLKMLGYKSVETGKESRLYVVGSNKKNAV